MRKRIATLAVVGALGLLSGCGNTVEGVEEDVQGNVEDAGDEVQQQGEEAGEEVQQEGGEDEG